MQPSSRVTIRDVAARAGVSVATVSRVLNERYGVAATPLARVRTEVVEITLHADLSSYTGRAGKRIVEPEDVELQVGTSSTKVVAKLHCTLTGPRREVGFDRIFGSLT